MSDRINSIEQQLYYINERLDTELRMIKTYLRLITDKLNTPCACGGITADCNGGILPFNQPTVCFDENW